MLEKFAYSLEETATLLSISRSAVKELAYSGKIKSVVVGRRRLIPRQAILEFLSPTNMVHDHKADWNEVIESA